LRCFRLRTKRRMPAKNESQRFQASRIVEHSSKAM
jgi:hypothetical protein